MSFLWEIVKGMTALQWLAGFAVIVLLIGFGAWRDSNRAPRRYRPEPREEEAPPRERERDLGRRAHSH